MGRKAENVEGAPRGELLLKTTFKKRNDTKGATQDFCTEL